MTFTLGKPPLTSTHLLLLLPLGLLALAIACGRGGSEDTSLTPQLTVVTNPSPAGACAVDLASSAPTLTIFGAGPGDFLADRFSLASGDFNGDGLDDVLVGAPLADGPDDERENSGEAYVLFGTPSPTAQFDLAAMPAGLTVLGERAGNNLGFTVASGDVNGDGLDDVLVGARFAGLQEKMAAGKAYVIFGRPGLTGTVDTAAEQQDITIIGTDDGDFLAIALASGDVNGDGTADLILGAVGGDGPNNGRPNSGEVALVLGDQDLPPIIDLAQEPPAFTVYAAAGDDNLPNHLAAGDTDGDGRDELIIGAPFVDADEEREDAGRVYIVPVPGAGGYLDLAEEGGFSQISGGLRKDALGIQVASADVNDDGKADVIVGARDADGRDDALNNSGEVHILFGKSDLPRSIDLADGQLDAVIYGADAGDSLGFTLASGDFNGDGSADLLMGAPIGDSCDNERQDGGEAYVVFGRPEFPEETSLPGGADLTFLGIEAGDELGFSLASGDFNGDGSADLMLGALQADGPDNARKDAGEVYVIFSEGR